MSRVAIPGPRSVIEGTGHVAFLCRDFVRLAEVPGDVFEDRYLVDRKVEQGLRKISISRIGN